MPPYTITAYILFSVMSMVRATPRHSISRVKPLFLFLRIIDDYGWRSNFWVRKKKKMGWIMYLKHSLSSPVTVLCSNNRASSIAVPTTVLVSSCWDKRRLDWNCEVTVIMQQNFARLNTLISCDLSGTFYLLSLLTPDATRQNKRMLDSGVVMATLTTNRISYSKILGLSL